MNTTCTIAKAFKRKNGDFAFSKSIVTDTAEYFKHYHTKQWYQVIGSTITKIDKSPKRTAQYTVDQDSPMIAVISERNNQVYAIAQIIEQNLKKFRTLYVCDNAIIVVGHHGEIYTFADESIYMSFGGITKRYNVPKISNTSRFTTFTGVDMRPLESTIKLCPIAITKKPKLFTDIAAFIIKSNCRGFIKTTSAYADIDVTTVTSTLPVKVNTIN